MLISIIHISLMHNELQLVTLGFKLGFSCEPSFKHIQIITDHVATVGAKTYGEKTFTANRLVLNLEIRWKTA